MGEGERALSMSREAFAESPSTNTLLLLANSLQLSKEEDKALELFQNWIEENPQDVAARLSYSDALELNQDVKGAITQYRAVLEQDPKNLMALNNLAWNIREDDPKAALELIHRASKLAPQEPAILDTQAVIEHLNGNSKAARRSIALALEKMPDNHSMRYHRAMITAGAGDRARAITILSQLVKVDVEEFPELLEAKELLRNLRQ